MPRATTRGPQRFVPGLKFLIGAPPYPKPRFRPPYTLLWQHDAGADLHREEIERPLPAVETYQQRIWSVNTRRRGWVELRDADNARVYAHPRNHPYVPNYEELIP